jgi:3-oxoacyl-[acyl-carrier protein] reductase
MSGRLAGKVAIVTGGASGIGRATCRLFAQEGAVVGVADVNEVDGRALAKELVEARGRATFLPLDVAREADWVAAVEQVLAEHGRLDILVNNAGVAPGGTVEELSEEVWDLNQDVNCKGTFLACRAVIPTMKTQRAGRILNAASFAAIVPSMGGAAYAASKAGVHYFTRVLAGELAPWNITVNCYAPGMVPTEMNHFAEAPAAHQRRLLDTLSIRRWGEPRDVANLVCFLASDLAGYITGTMVDVSGGKLATQLPRLAWEAAAAAGAATVD